MPTPKVDFRFVRKLALALPDVEESTSYGIPSFKLRGKLLTCQAINKSAEPNTLMVRIGFDERAKLLAAEPDIYYVTDHYVNYPSVLVRLPRIGRTALRELLRNAWLALSTAVPERKARARKKAGRRRPRARKQ